jgi:hypothetical protein
MTHERVGLCVCPLRSVRASQRARRLQIHRKSGLFPAHLCALALAASLIGSTVGAGAATPGVRRVVEDGVEHVYNSAQPLEPPIVYEMNEQWRLASETVGGELVFGMIKDVAVDGRGKTYLLDQALLTVHVVDESGAYLGHIGRGGEGPGELRSAHDLLVDREGRVGVLDYDGSRICYFTPDSLPAGDWTMSDLDGARVRPLFAHLAPQGVVAACRSLSPRGDQATLRYFCGLFGASGELTAMLYERRLELDRAAGIAFDEEDSEPVTYSAVDGRGWTYISPSFSKYEIRCYDERGVHRMTVEREYEHARRTAQEREDQLGILEAWYSAYRNAECRVEENERDILNLFVTEDGMLSVETSQGWTPQEPGVGLVLDQFNPQGEFVRQVILRGPMDAVEDFVRIRGGHCYRVTQAHSTLVSAMAAQGNRPDGGAGETEVQTVICYDLDATR